MSLLPKLYWAVAILSSLAFVVIFGMSLLGSDTDSDTDAESDIDGDAGDHDFGSYVLSLKSMVGFLVSASWVGIVTINNSLPVWITLLSSIAAGVIMTIIIVSLMTFFARMQYSGTLNIADTVGAEGEVYLSIPPSKSGKGKVQIKVQSAIREFDAVTEADTTLKQYDKIVVKSVGKNNVLLVEKIN